MNAWRIYPPWTIGAVLPDGIIEPSAAGPATSFPPARPGSWPPISPGDGRFLRCYVEAAEVAAAEEPGMGFRVEKDVMVRMRDGVELATDTWVPDQVARADPARAPAVRQGPDRAARLRADAEPVRADRGRLRGGVPGLPGHVPVGRRVRADAERAQRRRRHHRLAARAALVRRQHRHVRRVLPGVRAVGQRLGLPAPEGDRAGRDHHRLLHDPVVLRGRRAVLARGPVVVHGDGARRNPARGRGRNR